MNASYRLYYADSTWTLVRYRSKFASQGLTCWLCNKAIRQGAGCYRTRTWGPEHNETAHMHQKCLLGQIDPTVWDIPIGR